MIKKLYFLSQGNKISWIPKNRDFYGLKKDRSIFS